MQTNYKIIEKNNRDIILIILRKIDAINDRIENLEEKIEHLEKKEEYFDSVIDGHNL